LVESEQYTTTIKIIALEKTCKDCIFFMQVKDKGYCRKEYSERKVNEPTCYNPLFFQ